MNVTPENIEHVLRENDVCGEPDLLSLHVDGMDFWIWKALSAFRPRVVIADVQTIWGADASVTVPYRSDFAKEFVDGFGVYCGASFAGHGEVGEVEGLSAGWGAAVWIQRCLRAQ